MADFKHCSLILECAKCEILNYLDPFTFWFFDGKVKCAGCDAIWAVKIDNGTRVSGPTEGKAPHDKLPGFAQSKDYKTNRCRAGVSDRWYGSPWLRKSPKVGSSSQCISSRRW